MDVGASVPTMIRFIALDIDGTLLDSRWQVPEVNSDAIRRATDAGIEVALVTGRRFDFARPVIEQIAAPLTMIVSGGALVKTRDGETLVRHLLPVEVARAVVEGTRDFRDATAVVFDRPRAAQVVHERLDIRDAHRRSYFQRNRDYITEVVPLEAALTEDPIQVMYSGGVQRMRDLTARVRALEAAPLVAIAVTEYESRDFSLVDVNRAGCTKGATLAAWVARKGLTRDEVMAVGDNFNDREMLEFAGVPVVMGNAVAELRALGWPITLDNDAGGVAAAIDRYALSGPST
jgi:Cof subfamily protein (haloacid dehalogenase superfamily)